MYVDLEIKQKSLTVRQPIGLFIENEFVKSNDGSKIDTINPATGEKITSFYSGKKEDVDKAVKAARKAYNTKWSKVAPADRGVLLERLCELIQRDKKILASLETLDSGKPYDSNAIADLDQIVSLTRYFAGAADKYTQGKYYPLKHEKYVYTIKAPYGVVGLVVPWNYPLAMASWKVQGCLAAGNTVVIKPAEDTSLSLLYFAQLVKEAGFPPGVFNVVPGAGKDVGDAIVTHMDIDKVSFTGSTKVGGTVLVGSGNSNLKDVTLECGGKSPAVVFEDANLQNAIQWTSNGIIYNSGQNCTANSRIYVQESIYDDFVTKFKKYIADNWSFGNAYDPFDESCTLGPVISQSQYERINEYIRVGCEDEKLKCEKLLNADSAKGYFIPPTVFTDVPQTSKLCREEIFGPVVIINKFKKYEDALELANDTNYGLASAVFTKNISVAHMFARDIQSGTVWVNSSNDEEPAIPFGGFKMSGIGRELGDAGVETFTQTKAIHMNIVPDV